MAIGSIVHAQTGAPQPTRLKRWLHKLGDFALEYWAHMITGVFGAIVLLALSVPLLTYLGLDTIAKPIFYSLHFVCAQIPSHSFYVLGHQLGMCARNVSIYGSMFAGGLIFILSKKRLRGIPWWFWALLVLPMAYDGLTQMFGLRESTWELRVLTGTLFGLANMWFVLPFIQKTLRETIFDTTPIQMATPASLPMPMNVPAPTGAQALPQTSPNPPASHAVTEE